MTRGITVVNISMAIHHLALVPGLLPDFTR